MTGITDMMKKAVIVYGAGISGRGAAGVLAQAGQQVFLYNDNPCTIEQELQVALQAAGGALIIGEAAFAATLAQAGLVVADRLYGSRNVHDHLRLLCRGGRMVLAISCRLRAGWHSW